MKKQYIIPACATVSIRTVSLLTASQNEYGDDQGLILKSLPRIPTDEKSTFSFNSKTTHKKI